MGPARRTGWWAWMAIAGLAACSGGTGEAPSQGEAAVPAEGAPGASDVPAGGTPGSAAATPMSTHQHRPGMIHEAGQHVMPFSLEATLHVFEMTGEGGIQDVVVREPGNQEQIDLIRQHLQEEAELFAQGNFSDPASLHGADMPGLAELAAGASRMEVVYSELPDGARITYTTDDPALVTAIHRWFGAQLSDHGTDATYR
jgi:hypothetical protein